MPTGNSVDFIIKANPSAFIEGMKTAERVYAKKLRQIKGATDKASGDMKKSLGKIGDKPFGNFEKQAKGVEAAVGRLSKRFLALAGAYVGIRSITASAQALTRVGGEFEKLKIQLESVMGSVAGGRQAFAWVKKFTANTPFQLNAVTAGFVKLKAFGIEPMDGAFQSIADASSKLGGSQETLNGIILAVGQAWAKQKLQGEEILQLVERGVPVWDLLQKATGKNVTQLQKLSEQGKLGRDVMAKLITEIGKWAKGASAAQVKTFTGSVSNAKDAMADFLNTVAESGALASFTALIQDALKNIKKLKKSGDLALWAKNISDAVTAPIDAIRFWIKWIGKAEDAANEFSSSVPGRIALAIAKFSPFFVFILKPIADAIKTTQSAFKAEIAAKRLADSMQELINVQKQLETKGFAGIALIDEIKRLKLALAGGFIPIDKVDENIALLRGRAGEIIQIQKNIDGEKTRLNELERISARGVANENVNVEQQAGETIKQMSRGVLEEKIRNGQQELVSLQNKLDGSVRLEQRAADRIKNIRETLLGTSRSIDDQIRRLKDKGLAKEEQQASRTEQINDRINKSQDALAKGNINLSKELLGEARSLTAGVASAETAVGFLTQIKEVFGAIADAEIKNAEKTKKKQKEKTDEIKKQLDTLLAKLAEFKKDWSLTIEADTQKAMSNITRLKQKLAEIKNKTVTVTIKEKRVGSSGGGGTTNGGDGGGASGGFAHGGRLPGWGGGDSVHALLEPGEWVINKFSSHYYGDALLRGLNQMTIPRGRLYSAIKLPGLKKGGQVLSRLSIPEIPAKFATGGKTGQNQQVDHFVNLGQKRIGPLRGSADVVTQLVDALNKEGLGYI